MNFNLDEGASKILRTVKEEIRKRDNSNASFSDAVRELDRISNNQKEFDKLTKEMLKQSPEIGDKIKEIIIRNKWYEQEPEHKLDKQDCIGVVVTEDVLKKIRRENAGKGKQ